MPDSRDTCGRKPYPKRKRCGFNNIGRGLKAFHAVGAYRLTKDLYLYVRPYTYPSQRQNFEVLCEMNQSVSGQHWKVESINGLVTNSLSLIHVISRNVKCDRFTGCLLCTLKNEMQNEILSDRQINSFLTVMGFLRHELTKPNAFAVIHYSPSLKVRLQ